jgi:2-keto-3-deoxy-L-rhamnonate aldolase RhmA
MALAGFDFVIIDLEHSPMNLETASTLIAVSRGRGLVPLVRVPEKTQAWVQRCLDAGASGVLAPHVDSVDEAHALVRAARFEPAGTRGVGPTTRAGNWGLTPMGEYFDEGAAAAVIAQIESEQGVRSAAEMAVKANIDALFVGPADLSRSMGVAPNSKLLANAMRQVVEACQSASVPVGTAIGADPLRAAKLAKEGYDFVMVSNDATILGTGARSLVEAYHNCAH